MNIREIKAAIERRNARRERERKLREQKRVSRAKHYATEKIDRRIWWGAQTNYLQRLLCRKWQFNHKLKEQP